MEYLKLLTFVYREEPHKKLTRIKISKVKLKTRGSEKSKLEFEPAFDYSKTLKNSEVINRPASAIKIVNKREESDSTTAVSKTSFLDPFPSL
jgi:hypothetical protein